MLKTFLWTLTLSMCVQTSSQNSAFAQSEGGQVVAADERSTTRAFGNGGVTVLGGNVGLHNLTFSDSDATQLSVVVDPSVDYFILPHLSIGGFVRASYSDSKRYDYFGPFIETEETGYGAGARVGFNVEASKLLSVWPKVGFGVSHSDTTQTVLSAPSGFQSSAPYRRELGANATWMELSIPLLLHAAPHFFFGMGPYAFSDMAQTSTLSTGQSQQHRRTGIGLSFSTGGWI